MAAGYAHIIKLGTVEDSTGRKIPQYQFTFNNGVNTFARTFSEEGLAEFLREDIGIRPDLLDRVLGNLRAGGDSMIEDLHLSGNEAAALGLAQVASEV